MHVKIKEIIVVEGKNDTNVLKSYLDCDTIETHGTHIGKQILQQIKNYQKTRGIIIFTDPDFPGEKIRSTINQAIPGCKNAFIEKDKAKTTKKVGVEHASKEDIIESLKHLMSYDESIQDTLSFDEFIDLDFNGKKDSSLRRAHITKKLSLGKTNAKTLLKRLNMLQLTKQDIEKIMEDFPNHEL
ncbi:MAG: ribonuclease M5 [Longicatena sp.]